MYIDGLLLFDTAAAITATAASTNVLDLLNARDMGVGDDPALDVVVIVTSALLSAGASTLQVQFQGSTDNTTWTTYGQTDAIPKANLAQGAKISFDVPRMPPHAAGRPRYLRLNYVVATGPFTGGNVTSFIVLDDQLNAGSPQSLGYSPGIVIAN
jgi:hypothetical protein